MDLNWGSLYLWIWRTRTPPGARDLVLDQQFFSEGLLSYACP
ncbi:hypothetical protein [Ktedonobacter sp. SOSP1-52]|nr:hypothetical protein [Ktedonobacter sp. SOSP1-52]